MQLILKKIDAEKFKQAENTFSSTFLKTLEPPYLQQKKIKNLILKEQFNLSETELQIANKNHKRGSVFFLLLIAEIGFCSALARRRLA